MSASQISDESFRTAVETAIKQSRLFASISPNGNLILEVVITQVGQPIAGIDMSVTMSAFWKVSKSGSTQPIWQDAIATKYTAKFGDSVVGMERLRLADEGAARENIREGLSRIAKLGLR